ncbi:hypothetical protein Riggi_8 [Bacillus phage Riggi]|uniref:Uncharacterized protein n=1 Tax=Bacillus phage Riggi TaxID=2884426 RepID=U5PW02_9CAUD|nr:hypothetical protein Riggi_8 [Bacillus phage Riggi]AGY48170.1 hypothetical protein Riggi_8 [Bacillus phage Riggi]
MEKLIGYTIPTDLDEYEEDGVIRVLKEKNETYTKKVFFTQEDIEVVPMTTLEDELNDFHNDIFILLENFETEDDE